MQHSFKTFKLSWSNSHDGHNIYSYVISIEHLSAFVSLPKDGWFGVSLGRPISVLVPKGVFGHIFTDVSSCKRQPQHGRQRGIVEYNANLKQKKM